MELTKEQSEVLNWICTRPVEIAHLLGFDKLKDLHNKWMVEMLRGKDDKTLQAHRGSYKTTCVAVVLALIIVIFPSKKTLFMRKTSADVFEIVAQVKKILRSDVLRYICKKLWGCDLVITTDRADQINTNLSGSDPRGTSQLVAMGIGSSITGKHFDFIFTDDIVNVEDRTSRAERERTKTAYQELQNIKNRDGRIFNTGTPWHKEDAFGLMPEAEKYDCYTTGLIDEASLQKLKDSMVASLFAANYELRHIASDKIIFTEKTGRVSANLAEQGVCHIDAAYNGEDFTAFTIVKKDGQKWYVFGKTWRKHVDDCLDDIISYRKHFNAGRISCEDNGDKGYLGKDLRARGERTHIYHESMNKFLKITTYLKKVWGDIEFVEGTDEEYIRMITDYTEDAEHDDPPDSLASLIRELWRKQSPANNNLYFI